MREWGGGSLLSPFQKSSRLSQFVFFWIYSIEEVVYYYLHKNLLLYRQSCHHQETFYCMQIGSDCSFDLIATSDRLVRMDKAFLRYGSECVAQ